MLFGDKTNESGSAFDRINVRRLFLGIERAIAIAGRNVMFEFNDEFTRAEFYAAKHCWTLKEKFKVEEV